MSNNKQSSVDAYCNSCNAFICDELITFEETCSNCGTQIEYFEETMSNNKQSMKLYTEEQVKKAIKDAYLSGIERLTLYSLIETAILIDLTPIELPSDEEIQQVALYNTKNINEQVSFINGATYICNKIFGDNNEQQETMSNNKQSMKLYTEEQVRNMLNYTDKFTPLQVDLFMSQINCIDLVTIENELDRLANAYKDDYHKFIYKSGGNLVLFKIQGGNK